MKNQKNQVSPILTTLAGIMFILGFLVVDMSHAHMRPAQALEKHLRPNSDKIIQAK